MHSKLYSRLLTVTLSGILLLLAGLPGVLAQTPGLIYKTATAGGSRVLDPNQDGYASKSRTGFINGWDAGADFSEIPYRQFPALLTEPIGDLNTGSSGGHTDLVPPTNSTTAPSTGSPIAAYFDGTNLLFRIRIGASSTASKGYSVLIDSNNDFTGTGANPGFEYEVLLAANFAVQVIQHSPAGPSTIFTGSADQYSQRVVAASTASGNPDYFYDYYVPLSAFRGGITAATTLRMSGITITSAQSGITGSVSDVGGVDFRSYNFDAPSAWRALINSFPPTTLNSLQTSDFARIAATSPIVSGPISAGSATISGTSVEAEGSVVTVFKNGQPLCTTTNCPAVSRTGTWTLSGLAANSLVAGDVITATVTAPNKSASPASAAVTVTAAPVCTTTPAATLTGQNTSSGSRYITGTSPYSGRQRITVYTVTVSNGIHNYTLQGSYVFTTTTANSALPNSTTGMSAIVGDVTVSKTLNYVVTVTPVDLNNEAIGCESVRSNQLCSQNGGTAPANSILPTINNVTGSNGLVYNTLSEAPAAISQINGTLGSYTAGTSVSIIVFKNTIQTAYRTTTTTANWFVNTSGLALAPGDILNVRVELNQNSQSSSACGGALSSTSNFVTIKEQTSTPVISPLSACGYVKTVSGTAAEPGSLVTIFTNGTSTNLSAVAVSNGNWAVNVSSLNNGLGIAPGIAITARAKTIGKATSLVSNSVTAAPAPANNLLTIAGPITEGQTTLTGTAPAGAQVTVYIEGTPFSAVTADASGRWTASGFSPLEVFAGAAVTASYKTTGNTCESERIAPVIVQCSPPSTTPGVSPATVAVCSGNSTRVTVSNSEPGIAYRLVTISGGIETEISNSVLGTGGTITLTSFAITANTTLRVRARKITGTACASLLSGSVTVTVNSLPANTNTLSISSASGCASLGFTVTVNGTLTGLSYQLVNNSTKAPIQTSDANPRNGNGGAITFSVPSVSATTTLGIRITNPSTGCFSDGTNTVTYTITGPAGNQQVSLSTPRICAGTTAQVRVQSNNDGASYQLFRAGDNQPVPGVTAQTGNGQVLSFNVSPTTTTTYIVRATGIVGATGNTCTTTLTNQVTLVVSATSAPVSAGGPQTVCGGSVTLQGSNPAPGTGLWTLKSKPTGSPDPTIANPAVASATATGLVSGTYTFTWTVTTNCSGTPNATPADVTIVVNCPASYNIAPPKYRTEYRVNDVLASASDPDGAITSATLVAGSGTLPTGTTLLSNGSIVVTNAGDGFLIPGRYPLDISTVDAKGGITINNFILNVYGPAPTIVPLPVELVYFTATVRDYQAHLEWLTASELDNDRFEVERSLDAKRFERIGEVKGKGTTSLETKYRFTDRTPVQGTVYYRLKQVDYDGEFAYSRVIAVNAKGLAQELVLQAYPNPFQDKMQVTLTVPEAQVATLTIYDTNGRRVVTHDMRLDAGVNRLELKLDQLQSGIYIIKVVGEGMESTTRIMKN